MGFFSLNQDEKLVWCPWYDPNLGKRPDPQVLNCRDFDINLSNFERLPSGYWIVKELAL